MYEVMTLATRVRTLVAGGLIRTRGVGPMIVVVIHLRLDRCPAGALMPGGV